MKLPSLKRTLLAIGIAVVVVAVAALVGSTVLLQTTTGARWTLSWASGSISAGSINVREVRGSLANQLDLRGVSFRTSTVSVSIERLALHWRLPGLFRRELDVYSLHADSVRVQQLVAAAPAETTAANLLPEFHLNTALRFEDVRVRDFLYVPLGDSGAFALDSAQVAGDFHGQTLRLSSLRASSAMFDVELHGRLEPRADYPLEVELSGALRLPQRPELRGNGQISGSVERPHLTLHLAAPCVAVVEAQLEQLLSAPRGNVKLQFSPLDPHQLIASVPSMLVSGQLEASGTPEHFVAQGVTLLRSDSLGAVDAAGAIAMSGDSLRVDRLFVTVPGRKARVNMHGLVTGLGGSPRAELIADWRELAWPLRGDTLVRSDAGRLHFAGTPARYALEFDGGIETAHGNLGRWQLVATGDTSHLDVEHLAGRIFGGSVGGRGSFAWRPRPSWHATLHGQDLNPGGYWPEWPGQLALEVETHGEMRDTVPDFSAHIARLQGTLKHLPLSGHGSIATNEETWSAQDLRLQWGDAHLSAEGSSGEHLDLTALLVAPDLSPFMDGASGALRAELKLSGRRAAPHVKLAAHGDSLAFGQMQVGRLAVLLDAGLLAGDSLQLRLDARHALLSGFPLDTLTVRASGNTGHHTLSGSARLEGDTLTLAASGGLASERWHGSLERFDLHTRQTGAWRLEAPVAVAVSAHEARLEHFCLKSGAHSIRGLADWAAAGALHAHAELIALPIGLIDPWLPEGARVIGTLDGTIDASAERPEGPLTARVRLTQGPSQVVYSLTSSQRDTVQLGQSKVTLDSDAHGARGALSVQWSSGDQVSAEIALPGFNALRPDTVHQVLEGQIRAHATDLAVLGAYVPGLDNTRGELSADLKLSGTLRQPEANGEVALRNGSGSVPALGVTLQDFTLTMHARPGGRMTLEGGVRSGTGKVAITGETELGNRGAPTVTIAVKGENFTCADTREAKVKMSPDMHIKLQGNRVDVTGQIDVPFARFVRLDKGTQLAVPPSSDVVLVGGRPDSTVNGPQVHSRVRIVISDDVEVRVPRFRGKPEGSILAIDDPGQATRATGELKVTEGTYRAYGQDLRIERGRLIFGGGPISNPGLDLRASRTATDGTIAGLDISGTAEAPELAIFSSPAMSQNDALSYVMFGKPANEAGGSGGAATMAASQLSVQGGDMLARGVAGKIGIQDASVESKEGSLQDASLFLGTYLSPSLYVSYGIGLFESSTTIRMRYKMTKHWSVQTESGSQHSGLLQYSGER